MGELRIALLMPVCKKSYNKYYCKFKNNDRFNILKKAINELTYNRKDIDFLITTNNFFYAYNNNFDKIIKNFLNKHFKFKKINNIIIGFDYKNYNSNTKTKYFNSFKGINSKVVRFKKDNNKFIISNSILECWPKCYKFCFTRQSRYFKYKNFSFGLLSCGDFLSKCNKKAKYLNKNTEIWIDLTHKSYSRYKQSMKSLSHNANASYIIFNQQVGLNTFINYRRNSLEYIYGKNNFIPNKSQILNKNFNLFVYKI